mgnify:CR=1 FL=1
MRPKVIRGPLAFLAYALSILFFCVLFFWGIVWPILDVFDVPITYLYVTTILAYVSIMMAIVLTVVKKRKGGVLIEKLPTKEIIEGVAKICPRCGTLASQDSVKCPKCGFLGSKDEPARMSGGPEGI